MGVIRDMIDNAQHSLLECNKKLVALLDKLNKIDTRATPHQVNNQIDDAKALARELSHETKYLHRTWR